MDKENVVIIIQARMGSSRLPGKTMMKLGGKPMLFHVIDRALHSKLTDTVVVATTRNSEDIPIVELSNELNVHIYCGSEDDVLDRYYQASKKYDADLIIRITADCPLIDPIIIDDLIKYYLKYDNKIDYANVYITEGLEAEIFNFSALKKSWKNANKKYQREHVTIYMHENEDMFICQQMPSIDLSHLRLTVDTHKDYIVVSKLFQSLYKDDIFHIPEIIKYLSNNPTLIEVNADILKNEGFLLSLKNEGLDISNPEAAYNKWVKKYVNAIK